MKINGNSINAVNAYVHASTEYALKKSATGPEKKKLDRVEFSEAGRAALEMNAAAAQKKAEAARAVRDSASPERIAALKEAVISGSYNVSSENIADAILNG